MIGSVSKNFSGSLTLLWSLLWSETVSISCPERYKSLPVALRIASAFQLRRTGEYVSGTNSTKANSKAPVNMSVSHSVANSKFDVRMLQSQESCTYQSTAN